MAEFFQIAHTDELAPAQMKRVTVNGKKLLLCNSAGTLYCVDAMCSHEDYSLHLGCIKDGKIKCSLHGSYFELATGAPTCAPADQPLQTYLLKIENGAVWVQV